MKNAHERFGTLELTKRLKDTAIRIRATLGIFVVSIDEGYALAHSKIQAHYGNFCDDRLANRGESTSHRGWTDIPCFLAHAGTSRLVATI